MAGDWIPMRTDLRDDPAVIAIAAELGVEEDLILGKLHRFWSWANRQTVDGNAPSVTKMWLDRHLCAQGFAQALENVGWLECSDLGIRVPNFERYNSQSAKRRLLTARRVAAIRHRKRNAASVTKCAPREEKRREEINNPLTPLKTRGKAVVFTPPTLEEVTTYCRERQNGIDAQTFLDHYETVGWRYGKGVGKPIKDWKAAVRTWEASRRAEESISKDPDAPCPGARHYGADTK